MLTPGVTGSLVKGGYHHIVNAQIVKADRRADDVHNGIHRAHLMEMYLFDGQTVGLGLCLCHNAEHLPGQLFCSVRCLHPVNDGIHIRNVAMHVGMHMIVMVVVTVLVGMLMLMTVSILVMVIIMVVTMVAVAVLVRMVMIMAMFIIVITVMMLVVMTMIVVVPVVMMVLVRMVVMMLMVMHVGALVQDHIKVAGVDAALEGSADLDLISIHMEACQRILHVDALALFCLRQDPEGTPPSYLR